MWLWVWHFYHSFLHINSGTMFWSFLRKELVFTSLRCYGLLVVVYRYLLWDLFLSEDLIQAETAASKKNPIGKKVTKMTLK